jgi:uncharacterized RDD family membrane protein YckC
MTQPPDDRGGPPGATPDPASSEQPTIAWTPPDRPPVPPEPATPDDPSMESTDAAPTTVPPAQSPLISAAPTPVVAWASPQAKVREVAPGLVFASTGARFVAYLIDLFILGVIDRVVVSALGAMGVVPTPTAVDPSDLTAVFTTDTFVGAIVTTAIGGAYFVLSWSGGRRATIGQRLLQIQVGNAFDGAPLAFEQAIRRWIGLGLFLGLFVFSPALVLIATTAQLIWEITLLVTTASSPAKQGLHDRLANSALVRPATAGNGLVTACLVLVLVLVALFVLSLVALIGLGSQLPSILSAVGESV